MVGDIRQVLKHLAGKLAARSLPWHIAVCAVESRAYGATQHAVRDLESAERRCSQRSRQLVMGRTIWLVCVTDDQDQVTRLEGLQLLS